MVVCSVDVLALLCLVHEGVFPAVVERVGRGTSADQCDFEFGRGAQYFYSHNCCCHGGLRGVSRTSQ